MWKEGGSRLLHIYIIIIIISRQFIKRRKWWFGPPHQGRFDIFNDDGRECSRLDSSYQRHITFACTGWYQLHPHHRLGIIIPRLIAGTNLPTRNFDRGTVIAKLWSRNFDCGTLITNFDHELWSRYFDRDLWSRTLIAVLWSRNFDRRTLIAEL